jgi:dienelactone hydrolase
MIRTMAGALALLLVAAPAAAQEIKTSTVAVVNDAGRSVPMTVMARPGKQRGIIYFSHGALSAPAKYAAMTEGWARAGYAVVAPLHADSSDWVGEKPAREAQTPWRLDDMRLARKHAPALLKSIGVSASRLPRIAAGHSFGALIAMLDPDPAVRVVIAFSPPGPVPGLTIPAVSKPMLTITGTADVLPMIAPTWQAHLAGHERAVGLSVACVGEGVDHYFGGVFGRPELPGPRQQAQFDVAMGQSLAMLAAYVPLYSRKDRKAAEKLFADQRCQSRGEAEVPAGDEPSDPY